MNRYRLDAVNDLIAAHRDEYDRLIAKHRGIAPHPCVVCGGDNLRSVPTCRPWCADTWKILRSHIGARREKQRLSNARNLVTNATTPEARRAAKAYVRRLRDGEVNSQGRKRWLVVGSATYELALECHRRRLPIVKQLPAPIRKQLREDWPIPDLPREAP